MQRSDNLQEWGLSYHHVGLGESNYDGSGFRASTFVLGHHTRHRIRFYPEVVRTQTWPALERQRICVSSMPACLQRELQTSQSYIMRPYLQTNKQKQRERERAKSKKVTGLIARTYSPGIHQQVWAGPGTIMVKVARHLSQRSETGVDPKDLFSCTDC